MSKLTTQKYYSLNKKVDNYNTKTNICTQVVDLKNTLFNFYFNNHNQAPFVL